MLRLEWRLFEVGHCLHLECGALRGGRWRVCEFPSPVGLLNHPSRGWLLFDTGYSQRFLDVTARFPAAMYRWVTPVRFDAGKAIVIQLRAAGVDIRDIGGLVLSHFHADHVAGMLDFPGVPVYCSRAGWESMHRRGRWSALLSGLLPELVPAALAQRVRFFEDAPRLPARVTDGGFLRYDLFGDGSLAAVELPGHSAGGYRNADTHGRRLHRGLPWRPEAVGCVVSTLRIAADRRTRSFPPQRPVVTKLDLTRPYLEACWSDGAPAELPQTRSAELML